MRQIYIITYSPDFYHSFLKDTIIKRGLDKNLFNIELINIRNFAQDIHKSVDNKGFGGGKGMILMYPIAKLAIEHCIKKIKEENLHPIKSIYFSPKGALLLQKKIKNYSIEQNNYIFLAGRFEDVDKRIISRYIDEEISIGDYVLSNGDLACQVFINTVARLLPGVIKPESSNLESFSHNKLLESDQYTRPRSIDGLEVPDVLFSGNHKQIENWKNENAIIQTWLKRPDLIQKKELSCYEKLVIKRFLTSPTKKH